MIIWKRIAGWWPFFAALVWLYGVEEVAGAPAAFFSAITGLVVAALAMWEAGGRKPVDGEIKR